MGFRRIGSVWFFSLLSAAFFLTLAAGLSGGPINAPMQATVAAPTTAAPTVHADPGFTASNQRNLPPLREMRVGNPDRRKVVMVPITPVGALLTAEADLALP